MTLLCDVASEYIPQPDRYVQDRYGRPHIGANGVS